MELRMAVTLVVASFFGTASTVTVVIPSTPQAICPHLHAVLNHSILRQTALPDRVVVGIASLQHISPAVGHCLNRAKKQAHPVLLEWNVVHEKPSPGGSRNAALAVVLPTERVVFHDIDDVSHPQWFELALMHMETNFCVFGSYVFERGCNFPQSPFCRVGNLSEVPTIAVDRHGHNGLRTGNLRVDRTKCAGASLVAAVPKAYTCGAIHHGNTAFRTISRGDRFTTEARGEDSRFIRSMMKRHQEPCVYVAFPVVCYKCDASRFGAAQTMCACS
eukprot:m.475423 g.475423  ORF g.475423 m.475423 type:complete len:275 (+) comp38340_c0_seq1:364-1188(+)